MRSHESQRKNVFACVKCRESERRTKEGVFVFSSTLRHTRRFGTTVPFNVADGRPCVIPLYHTIPYNARAHSISGRSQLSDFSARAPLPPQHHIWCDGASRNVCSLLTCVFVCAIVICIACPSLCIKTHRIRARDNQLRRLLTRISGA